MNTREIIVYTVLKVWTNMIDSRRTIQL